MFLSIIIFLHLKFGLKLRICSLKPSTGKLVKHIQKNLSKFIHITLTFHIRCENVLRLFIHFGSKVNYQISVSSYQLYWYTITYTVILITSTYILHRIPVDMCQVLLYTCTVTVYIMCTHTTTTMWYYIRYIYVLHYMNWLQFEHQQHLLQILVVCLPPHLLLRKTYGSKGPNTLINNKCC